MQSAPALLLFLHIPIILIVLSQFTDADGYVIPNLLTQDNDVTEPSIPEAKDPEPLQVCQCLIDIYELLLAYWC
jgi:hypothetical protein